MVKVHDYLVFAHPVSLPLLHRVNEKRSRSVTCFRDVSYCLHGMDLHDEEGGFVSRRMTSFPRARCQSTRVCLNYLLHINTESEELSIRIPT